MQKDSDVIMFGGEFLDTENDKMYVKNDLYRFHTADHSWSQIIAPNAWVSRLPVWSYLYHSKILSV